MLSSLHDSKEFVTVARFLQPIDSSHDVRMQSVAAAVDGEDADEGSLEDSASSALPGSQAMPLRSPEGYMCEPVVGHAAATPDAAAGGCRPAMYLLACIYWFAVPLRRWPRAIAEVAKGLTRLVPGRLSNVRLITPVTAGLLCMQLPSWATLVQPGLNADHTATTLRLRLSSPADPDHFVDFR
jgi:hypothetical protein